jgi:hypothetical protein
VLEGVRWGVEQIVQKLNISASPQEIPTNAGGGESLSESGANEEELGANGLGSGPINDQNLLSYLGLIEQKTNDLLTLYLLLNAPKKSAGQQPPATSGLDGSVVNPAGAVTAGGAGVVTGAPTGGEMEGQTAPGTAMWGAAGTPAIAATATATGSLVGHGPNPPIGNISILAPSTG